MQGFMNQLMSDICFGLFAFLLLHGLLEIYIRMNNKGESIKGPIILVILSFLFLGLGIFLR